MHRMVERDTDIGNTLAWIGNAVGLFPFFQYKLEHFKNTKNYALSNDATPALFGIVVVL